MGLIAVRIPSCFPTLAKKGGSLSDQECLLQDVQVAVDRLIAEHGDGGEAARQAQPGVRSPGSAPSNIEVMLLYCRRLPFRRSPRSLEEHLQPRLQRAADGGEAVLALVRAEEQDGVEVERDVAARRPADARA